MMVYDGAYDDGCRVVGVGELRFGAVLCVCRFGWQFIIASVRAAGAKPVEGLSDRNHSSSTSELTNIR